MSWRRLQGPLVTSAGSDSRRRRTLNVAAVAYALVLPAPSVALTRNAYSCGWRRLTVRLRDVDDGRGSVSHDPPSTWRWRRHDRIPEGSEPDQLTVNGDEADETGLPVRGRATGAPTLGSVVSAAAETAGAAPVTSSVTARASIAERSMGDRIAAMVTRTAARGKPGISTALQFPISLDTVERPGGSSLPLTNRPLDWGAIEGGRHPFGGEGRVNPVTARRRGRRLSVLAAVALIATAVFVPGTAAAAAPDTTAGFRDGRYIVTFVDAPVAEYNGYVDGYAATEARAGRKLNAHSNAANRWSTRLTRIHDRALARVGAQKIYSYTITNNGVAAELTARQAAALAKDPQVAALEADRLAEPNTTLSPSFLGLDAGNGLWSQLGGPTKAGAGVVVGVLDSGIWPESPAFAGGTGIPVPSDWHGVCVSGEQFNAGNCNDKLIGARFYYGGFGKGNIATADFLSPRDGSGHGSHTSSTAAGNYGTTITIDGDLIGTGSGMAPGAKVAMYKVCWAGKAVPDGCYDSDSVAAVNDAVADGVDVINFSIGGSSESTVLDPVAMAFRGAQNAGVFVANSAGNSGPGASTLDHPAPWVTTVAAATFRRAFQAVELGSGARYVGASVTPSLPEAAPLVYALSVKVASASDANAKLCIAGTLDPAKAAGKVVLCDRGVNARIDKGFEVQRAGGVGIILANPGPNSLNGDYHPVPAVHVDVTAGTAIKAYIGSAGAAATAKIVPLTATELAAAPQVPEVTDFSSRGPSTTTGGDILKPDIAAPGNDVVAAVAPPTNHDRMWDFMSGTSMSSPHIAGIGALLKARHPTWLPSEIKSAIMTSATDTVSSAGDWFAQGAGFVQPNGAADPGLVYPTTANEYRQYLVGLGVRFSPPFDTLTPISGSELNQASIAIGKLAGVQSVTRTVKNVGTASARYRATVDVPGFDVTVSPSSLNLAAGQSATFTVTFTRDDAAFGEWATGIAHLEPAGKRQPPRADADRGAARRGSGRVGGHAR